MPMLLEFLLRGFVIGFAIAAPVGPMGVLCITRTFGDGEAVGILAGWLRGCFNPIWLVWVNRLSGLFLLGVGVFAIPGLL